MANKDYDKEVLNEGGYLVELSNQGEKKKHNPNFYNKDREKRRCVGEVCDKITPNVYCQCSKHKRLIDYPLHTKDWLGRTIPPDKTREECKTFALPHYKISELIVRWINGDEKKGAKVDSLVDDTIKEIHEKVPDATRFQKILDGEKKDDFTPDYLIKITQKLIDKHFPKEEFEKEVINAEDLKFKKINIGNIPLRIVLANVILAFACEESNRGDARGCKEQGLKPRYANIFMPLSVYLIMRKGAIESEARMVVKG